MIYSDDKIGISGYIDHRYRDIVIDCCYSEGV